ncbi:hypothetical protein Val02_63730 [Virgisporangium aliadipatigenens]|uniref:histidine kinase n=1 Tax=Virgisporangium aliadipatigenens TaxID=741659 RepID=A0A8J3YRU2_9ACTN|nr:ATP-binding protein [Virgisporangium aliadipatigenens]GIJ49487.1 hypothetical protein Val02_63730 [Virgisporangium aliadipatigenens]
MGEAELAAELLACTRTETVLDTAARTAASLIGDAAVLWVRGEEGGGTVVAHHRDPETDRLVTEALAAAGEISAPPSAPPGERRELAFTGADRERVRRLVPESHRALFDRVDVTAGVLCPLVAGEAFLGYLAVVGNDVDVPRAAAAADQVSAALATARTVERADATARREHGTAETLRRQLDELRRTDSIGQLVGGIAHDFNNLLTYISGAAEVLTTELDPESPQHELAAGIVESAARGGELTRQLQSFGQHNRKSDTVSVADLLHGVGELLGRALGEHIRLSIGAAPDVWSVKADRGQLEQALANLATNARDAMGRGGTLTIEASNAEIEPGQLENAGKAAGRFVRLVVSDTGVGMDPTVRARAFDDAFTTKGERGGTGQGLGTVDRIVRGAGGHIQLYSEPGLGTTVNLFLPATEEPEAPPRPAVVERPSGRRAHILVVEDQPELARLTQQLLQPDGYTVTVATDPAGAIAHIHTGAHPDLLLTDVVMPGMTGPELARALRARRPTLRVLYMSGYTAGVLNPQGHLDQDSALLQKPFNRETLLAAVSRALAR